MTECNGILLWGEVGGCGEWMKEVETNYRRVARGGEGKHD